MQKIILSNFVILFFCIILLFGGCATIQESRSEGSVTQKGTSEITFPDDSNLILLPVTFKGKEYQFILDTGATTTVFDTSLKSKLRKWPFLSKKAKAADGKTIKVEYFHAPHARLGKFCLHKCYLVAVFDLDLLSTMAGKKVHGIIGMDFLKRYIVQIDFNRHTVSFIKPKFSIDIFSFLRPEKNEHPEWGEPVSIRYRFISDQPYIRGKVQDISVNFLVDTGFTGPYFGGFLESKIFKEIYSKSITKKAMGKDLTIAGEMVPVSNKVALPDKLCIGPFVYDDAVFLELTQSILGLGFLSHHIVTFDFPKKKIYLKKVADFERPDYIPLFISGFEFTLGVEKDGIFVESVELNGPAYKKGIRPKDIILKVNNQDVTSYGLTKFVHFLLSLSKQRNIDGITFTIKRGADVNEVSFPVRKKI